MDVRTRTAIVVALAFLVLAVLACSRDLRIDQPGLWCVDTNRDGRPDAQIEVCPGSAVILPAGTAVWRCGDPVGCPTPTASR